jgi:hypothetical protein
MYGGVLKLLIGSTLAIHALVLSLRFEVWWFIQNVNLLFHEAGHVILMAFGNIPMLLGGTIMELLVPSVASAYFVRRREYFSATFGFWWLHSAILSVSIYISDAQERALPLITGDVNTHDWFQLLSGWGLLRYDDLIGTIVWLTSFAVICLLVVSLSKDSAVTRLFHGN